MTKNFFWNYYFFCVVKTYIHHTMTRREQVICHFSPDIFHSTRMITCRNSVCWSVVWSVPPWLKDYTPRDNQREMSGNINSSWCVKVRVTEFQIHKKTSKQRGEYQHRGKIHCLFSLILVWFEAGCWFPSQFEYSCDMHYINCSFIITQLSISCRLLTFTVLWLPKMAEGNPHGLMVSPKCTFRMGGL